MLNLCSPSPETSLSPVFFALCPPLQAGAGGTFPAGRKRRLLHHPPPGSPQGSPGLPRRLDAHQGHPQPPAHPGHWRPAPAPAAMTTAHWLERADCSLMNCQTTGKPGKGGRVMCVLACLLLDEYTPECKKHQRAAFTVWAPLMLKFSSGECSPSLPCQVDVPCQDEMRDAGAMPGDRDLLTKQFFTQLDPVLDYLTIWTFCFCFVFCFFGTSAVRGTDFTPEFPWDDPWASQKSGWSARNYWAIRRPTAYEPITRSDRTLTPLPCPPRGQLTKQETSGVELISHGPHHGTSWAKHVVLLTRSFFKFFYVRIHTS